jgi:hypothetical protein
MPPPKINSLTNSYSKLADQKGEGRTKFYSPWEKRYPRY